MGGGAQPSFWRRLDAVRAPTLVIAGSLDAKYADVAMRMAPAIPNAELRIVPDCRPRRAPRAAGDLRRVRGVLPIAQTRKSATQM